MDCLDGSDEQGCKRLGCVEGTVLCGWECVPPHYPSFLDCGLEQRLAQGESTKEIWDPPKYIYPPALVHMDGFGLSTVEKLGEEHDICPDTHFQCPRGFCIPTFLINNKVLDCPLGHDENTTKLTCPGFYRCYQTSTCLHPDFLCDGINHCPLHDDEQFCDEIECPSICVCEGYAIKCQDCYAATDLEDQQVLRYLDLSGVVLSDLTGSSFISNYENLQFLNMSFCKIKHVKVLSRNFLRSLDLSHNNISDFKSSPLYGFPQLLYLDLSFNPLSNPGHSITSFLSRTSMRKLQTLKMKNVGLEMILSNWIQYLPQMSVLDISQNVNVDVEDTVVFNSFLQVLYTDNPKLCCSRFHITQLTECHAPVDELSSCSDLLRSDVLRVLLWILSVMAVKGNIGVLIYRAFLEPQGTSLAYRVLVINLSAADFLMGVYMTIIGGADIFFRGFYVMIAEDWRQSSTCKAAGFLAMLSSEISALIICLITLDRLLVLRFPFSKRLRLSKLSASLTCVAVWIAGVLLATVPLTQSHWNFYSQNGTCLPLPITRQKFDGQQYAFGVFIAFNFTLVLFIGAGQSFIYHFIHSTSKATQRDDRKKEMIIARRLFLIVFTDFCCWFPIGLMGLLAARGTPIPGLVNVWAAVFVLPLNSALNPFLYTLNTLLERRARKREGKRLVKMMNNLHAEIRTWPHELVEELIHHCLKSRLVGQEEAKELIVQCLRSGLVDMEQLRDIWVSQLGDNKEQVTELVRKYLRSGLVDMEHSLNISASHEEDSMAGTVSGASSAGLKMSTGSEIVTTLVEMHDESTRGYFGAACSASDAETDARCSHTNHGQTD